MITHVALALGDTVKDETSLRVEEETEVLVGLLNHDSV